MVLKGQYFFFWQTWHSAKYKSQYIDFTKWQVSTTCLRRFFTQHLAYRRLTFFTTSALLSCFNSLKSPESSPCKNRGGDALIQYLHWCSNDRLWFATSVCYCSRWWNKEHIPEIEGRGAPPNFLYFPPWFRNRKNRMLGMFIDGSTRRSNVIFPRLNCVFFNTTGILLIIQQYLYVCMFYSEKRTNSKVPTIQRFYCIYYIFYCT